MIWQHVRSSLKEYHLKYTVVTWLFWEYEASRCHVPVFYMSVLTADHTQFGVLWCFFWTHTQTTVHQTSCARGDTICLRSLQVDNIFAFIRQVAPVLACWLLKTSATSWPLNFWPWKWCPSHVSWATSVPILVFLGLSILVLGLMYATALQKHSLMTPLSGGGGIIMRSTRTLQTSPTRQLADPAKYLQMTYPAVVDIHSIISASRSALKLVCPSETSRPSKNLISIRQQQQLSPPTHHPI